MPVPLKGGGEIVVADGYGHGFVHRFDSALAPQRRWGGVGIAPGELKQSIYH